MKGVVSHGVPLTLNEILGPFGTTLAGAAPRPTGRFACETEPEYWWHHPAYLAGARSSCCDGGCAFLGVV